MRRVWTDRIMWGLAVIVLVAAAIWVTGGIESQAADTRKDREAYYQQLEREYIGRVLK